MEEFFRRPSERVGRSVHTTRAQHTHLAAVLVLQVVTAAASTAVEGQALGDWKRLAADEERGRSVVGNASQPCT